MNLFQILKEIFAFNWETFVVVTYCNTCITWNCCFSILQQFLHPPQPHLLLITSVFVFLFLWLTFCSLCFPCTFISAPRSARTMTAEFLVVGIYIFNCHIKLLTKSGFYLYVYLSVCFTLRTICTYTNNDLVKYCSNKIKSITVVGILFCFIWKISSSSSYICFWNCNYNCDMFYKWSL